MASIVNSSNKPRRRMCSCSPSNHAGAFRCSHHNQQQTNSMQYSRNGRLRSADRELLKRALMTPVRRSVKRCRDFRPTPSRLSSMSIATKITSSFWTVICSWFSNYFKHMITRRSNELCNNG
ncbi:hypothetical protein MKW94_012792 [Papaver nudicaule]|uniref:Uncharacterized protein n=1 Tax=Papaver nudicaule TaxID=74823 RepID=A0AA41UXG4_PAPNU|nr:hypothetical protein [Papaver nudicaule]